MRNEKFAIRNEKLNCSFVLEFAEAANAAEKSSGGAFFRCDSDSLRQRQGTLKSRGVVARKERARRDGACD